MKITHDFHIHTTLSLCAKETATLEHYINKAKELGLKKIGIANHMWDAAIPGANRWYQKQSYAHISQIREELAAIDTQGVEVYIGCETEYCADGHRIALSEAVAEQLDFVLAPNSHTHLAMPKEYYEPYQKHVDFMLKAWFDILTCDVSKYVTAIPHPFMAVCCPYDFRILMGMITDAQYRECFSLAKEKNVAIEINPHHYAKFSLSRVYEDEFMRMNQIAKVCGCKFIIGSDAHTNVGHDQFHYAYIAASLLELSDEDIADIAR